MGTQRFSVFIIPGYVLATLVISFALRATNLPQIVGTALLLSGIILGSLQLVRDTVTSLLNKSFALDYIALLAIITGLVTGNFFVAGVIVLMMAGGNTLEDYAQEQAKRSLTALSERIPHSVVMVGKDADETIPIQSVPIGTTIKVRKGEVIPLDGTLMHQNALIDESSLTGEAYPVEKDLGELLRSGTINMGNVITIKTTVRDENSTYRKIIELVEKAQSEKTPFLQLADKLSGWFTVASLLIAGVAYFISHDIERVLAVLVIATPCPLILATPIALIGGMNVAARDRIIFKRLSALEILSQVRAMIFDKTGTVTFGVPELTKITIENSEYTEKKVLSLAAGLEKNSLHPFAKTIIKAADSREVKPQHFDAISEIIGKGISGKITDDTYTIEKLDNSERIVLKKNKKSLAFFEFSDVIKPESKDVLKQLTDEGLALALFTGDTKERTLQLLPNLPENITVQADLSPTDKQAGIVQYKKKYQQVAMVGDGINDAPALAQADVGIAFSHDEHTAASEAADVILLGGTFATVLHARKIARRTLFIAKQSMYVGVALSLIGMSIAVTGKLPPIAGAVTQEVIDVAVILNALRAAFGEKNNA